MKYQIRKGANSIDGSDIYRIYEIGEKGFETVVGGASTEVQALEFVNRKINPIPEVVIATIEG